MTRAFTWIAFAAIATATMFSSRTARADGKNEIRAVTFDDDAGTTRIHVRGAETPTFTVYKLERPSRVVVDVPRARLADSLRGHEGATVMTPSTWAVSTIAAQQIDDGGQLVRVIVTLARPGRYDVKTVGNEVVVMVTARDAAPKTTNPAELEQAKAEAERLRKVAAELQKQADDAKRNGAQANQAELAKLKAAAQTAQAAADRARVDAEAAQKVAVADANRAREEAARSRADADAAKQLAAREVNAAAKTRADAERMKQDAAREAGAAKLQAAREIDAAAKSRADADRAKQVAARETEAAAKSRADADRAKQDAAAAKQLAAREADAAAKTRADAEMAKQAAAREADAAAKTRADAEAAKQLAAREAEAAARSRADAERVKQQAAREAEEAAKTLAAAERAKQEALREAEAAKQQAARDAEAAKQAVAREATAAKQQAAREAEAARLAATREAEAARADLAKTKADAAAARIAAQKELEAAARAKADAERARREAETARNAATAVAAASRNEVEAAKADAAKVRAEAEAAKIAAAADRKSATQARIDADRTLREANIQLAALDKKTQSIQAMEDKARAASAAAQAREDAAREEVARAAKERAVAEAAAKSLATKPTTAEAKAAEERLAKAKRATEDAEAKRIAAETAAESAKKELDQTRGMLTAMEQQRTAAETAATTAARKRSEAEAAASDATRRKSEAEVAAAQAARLRKDAEQAAQTAAAQKTEAERDRAFAEVQKKQAEQAARDAKLAAEAAEKQRTIAEAATRTAGDKRKVAEASLDALTAKRLEAERAATLFEQRSKAEAKARAEIAAAEARKAGDAEIQKAKTEVARLAKERILAENELADRRKAVAAQQSEAARLEAAATQARDAATREEARRAQLAQQLATETDELARIKAQKIVKAPVVVAEAKKGPMAKVNDIRFQGDDSSAQVDIAMTPNAQITVGEVTATTAELIIDNAELAQKLERKLDVTKFGSPVRAVSSFRDRRTPNRVRLVAELAQPATPVFERSGNGGAWKFVQARTVAKGVQNIPAPVVAGFGATSTPITQQSVTQLPQQGARGRRIYRGAVIDLDFKDAPLHDLLRLLGDTGRVNFVIPDNIDPKITVRLKRVPWDQALDVILQSHQLWYRRDGNLYRIAPRAELDKEDEAEAARREAAVKAETPRSKVLRLNYAASNELQQMLQPMLSPRGRIEVDPRTNSLIIVDVAGNRDEIERLALSLDTQTPQITIEARIVEARSTFVRQFGIQWGGRATASPAGGNATGLIFPSSIDFRGANVDGQTNAQGIVAPSDFAVNMPAATGTGEGGAVGLSLGSIAGNFAINLRLSALEDTGTIRIISAPKVTVLNNKTANISQGVSIPISVISAAGTQTQFVQADLSLNVRPYVSPRDCAIAMQVTVTKNEPDFVNVGARGDPTILRKEARTEMLVNDGETSVLGGIYTRNSGLAYKKVPFLAEIPVLGWFFKNRRENDDRTEILVFITPKITNRALLSCQ